VIETENLSMSYGSLQALDNLNLKIEPGEFFAFLGPNAAGKTTTIKLITGLLRPTSGTARVCGFDIQEKPLEAKRRIGFIPDVAVFYDKLTTLEFMQFTAELFEVDPNQAQKDTAHFFERFSLNEFTHQLVENLSHGTRQRLAIASAMLHRPEVIIIDEPMVGLDPHNARVVKDELKERSREGATVFMSTHLLNVAEELADRVGIINHGKLVRVDTVENLREQRKTDDWDLESFFLELTRSEESSASAAAD
jgi:ABC-2 type transport system ATP-binding protein